MSSCRGAARRAGISVLEIIAAAAAAGLLIAVAAPLIQQAREAARGQTCRDHLHRWTLAARQYHDAQGSLPPAARWDVNATASLALHRSKRVEAITQENWAVLLLPFMEQAPLSEQFAIGRPIGSAANASARMTSLDLMACPADGYNREDNFYRLCAPGGDDCVEFARGNYAINGGSHSARLDPPDASSPKGDSLHLVMEPDPRSYALWGNGVAGINKSFSLGEFANGEATLVAFEELRAGVHPLDPRGAWALGQIGGSVTWAHGVNSDAYAPNHQWPRSDDILGCRALQEQVGKEFLRREGMPCVDYIDENQQATSRSLHAGGVYMSFLDGSVRFIADGVDPGLWHVMHSRETPAAVLADAFDEKLAAVQAPEEADPQFPPSAKKAVGERPFVNSAGMRFIVVPAGEYTMGVPDTGHGSPPAECPAHRVRITRAFLMGACEVTRAEFRKAMGEGSSEELDERLPMVGVTWREAAEFCRRLSARPEERSAGRHYRLPTEAEWEYACRAGRDEPYEWSQYRSADDESGDAAGITPPLPLAPVGSYPPNAFGLHDMRGNAWEWTADWFDRDYYLRSPRDDPRGPSSGYLKVVRGGDWRFVGELCHIDYPMLPPWKANPAVGFRVVCEIVSGGQNPPSQEL
jgi:formylglycine-generating enzyme required for sulfatase activity